MTHSAPPAHAHPSAPARPPAQRRPHPRRAAADALVCAGYLLAAAAVLGQLWGDPTGRIMALNSEDQTLYEWFLANDTLLWTGESGLLTDRLNHPEGFNLMANTTVIALGMLLTPVTLAWGAPVTFAVIATANLAGTAAAWYLLLARGLRRHRLAAAMGGALCGFAPGMVSQNISHLHMSAQWLVPPIVWCVVLAARTAEPRTGRRRTRRAAALGLAALVVVQVFVGEEVLFLTAFALLLLAGAYALRRPGWVRRVRGRFLTAMGVTALVAGSVLAYPLWFQFFGPQGVRDGLFKPEHFSADLLSWVAFSPLSVAGGPEAARLTSGPSEYNTFLGVPLLAVAAAAAVWLRRRPAVAACAAVAAVMALLSLGPWLVVDGERTPVPGPFWLVRWVPLVDGALPMRFALAVIPLVGVILAYAVDAALRRRDALRWAVPVVTAAALAPLAPTPVPAREREPLPRFVTGGGWRQCAPRGGVLVTVPTATPPKPAPMRYPTAAGIGFAVPEGFFIGPYGVGGSGAMGVSRYPISQWLADVGEAGVVPPVGPGEVAAWRQVLDFWRADCVAVADQEANAPVLRETLTALFGRPGVRVDDAVTWTVTPTPG